MYDLIECQMHIAQKKEWFKMAMLADFEIR